MQRQRKLIWVAVIERRDIQAGSLTLTRR